MVKICKACTDPCWCQSFLEECEIEASERLEDSRQSEAFNETYNDEKKYEEDELRQEFKDNFEED